MPLAIRRSRDEWPAARLRRSLTKSGWTAGARSAVGGTIVRRRFFIDKHHLDGWIEDRLCGFGILTFCLSMISANAFSRLSDAGARALRPLSARGGSIEAA